MKKVHEVEMPELEKMSSTESEDTRDPAVVVN